MRERVRGYVRGEFESDAELVGALLLVVYVSFTVAGVLMGLDLNGIVSTLQRVTFFAAVYALMALALNLQWGYAGLFNIGVAGFMAVGVYTMAILTNPTTTQSGVPGLGLPLVVGIVGGVVAAAVVGFVAALPALRLEADYLAIVTLALAEIIRLVANSSTFASFTVGGVRLGTGGATGLDLPTNPINAIFYTDPGRPASPPTAVGELVFGVAGAVGLREPVVVNVTYTFVLVLFVGGFYLFLARVGNSPFGRVLKAISEDDLVARSLGKNTRVFKTKVFVLGCALMALGGILWQGSQASASPSSFQPVLTFYIFIALIVGGSGSNTGSVVGGILFASVLFEGPVFLGRLVDKWMGLVDTPDNVIQAVAPLASGEVVPFVAYLNRNLALLRFMFVGVVLVYLIQNRPKGILGHRKEPAAGIDLDRDPAATHSEGTTAGPDGTGGPASTDVAEAVERGDGTATPEEGIEPQEADSETPGDDPGSTEERVDLSPDDDGRGEADDRDGIDDRDEADELASGLAGTVAEGSDGPGAPIVEVDGVTKHFGGITAVDRATFDVAEGSLTGLIGPNGAGKSTLFNLITGVHRPDAGTVRFRGRDVTRAPPHRVAQAGLVRTFQISRTLSEMTVIENMMLAPTHQGGEQVWRSVTPRYRQSMVRREREIRDRAWEVLETFEIDHLAHDYASNLSGGQRKLLEVARALMSDPQVLLLDEPFSGVNPTLERKLLARMHDLIDEGYTILLVEHDMDIIRNNCDHVVVMHRGSVLAEGPPEDIMRDARVIEAYLGGSV